MVDSSIMFTKYVSKWATNLRAISLNVGVTTFGPPCIYIALKWNVPYVKILKTAWKVKLVEWYYCKCNDVFYFLSFKNYSLFLFRTKIIPLMKNTLSLSAQYSKSWCERQPYFTLEIWNAEWGQTLFAITLASLWSGPGCMSRYNAGLESYYTLLWCGPGLRYEYK